MSSLPLVDRAEALRSIPDMPNRVEFRAVALDAASTIFRSGRGLLLVDARQTTVCVLGEVTMANLTSLVRSRNIDCELVAEERAVAALRDELDWHSARIATLAGPWQPPRNAHARLAVRPLRANDPLEHLPDDVQQEIARFRDACTVFVGVVDGRVVCVAYAPWASESWADIGIDTHEEFQNQGIGTQVAAALIESILAAGKQPVWGAEEDNGASLRLADKLGFRTPAGRLWVAEGSAVIGG
ncbi:MAG: GNAT family N-acetyltransferase [Pirellulales bacterium]